MNDGMDMSKWPSSKEIRAWANSRRPGYVHDKGQLPRAVIIAWNRMNPDRQYVDSQGFHGTEQGYGSRGCRCLQCSAAGVTPARARYVLRRDDRDDERAEEFLSDVS